MIYRSGLIDTTERQRFVVSGPAACSRRHKPHRRGARPTQRQAPIQRLSKTEQRLHSRGIGVLEGSGPRKIKASARFPPTASAIGRKTPSATS